MFKDDFTMNLDANQTDVLQEVGNIGAGHAATALSTLLGHRVTLSVTSARLCKFGEIPEILGGPEALIAGVFLRVEGEVHGNIMFLLPIHSAKRLITRLMLESREIDDFTELELSALSEVGNILGGSYLNALHMLTGLSLQQSVPAVAIDMAGAILDIGIIMSGTVSDSAILIDTRISQGESDVDAHVFLLPDPESTDPLLRALGGSYD
jgi:chemotaxis protein CheC